MKDVKIYINRKPLNLLVGLICLIQYQINLTYAIYHFYTTANKIIWYLLYYKTQTLMKRNNVAYLT